MPDPDLPGYAQDRLGWQAPAVLPTGSLAELARAVRDALQGAYSELVKLAARRNVVALQGDTLARVGQVIAGISDGQVITLPSPNPGELGTISVLLVAIKSACTVVNPDASFFTLGTAGLYEFGISPDDTSWKAVSPAAPIALSMLAAQAANTVVANATAASASPTAFPVGTNTVLGRVAANIVAAQLVGAQVAAATLPLTTLATQAANTILAEASGAIASPTAVAVASESVFGRTSGNLQAITSSVQTALIRAAGSVFWAAAAANQVLRRSGAGDLGFGLLVDGNLTTNTLTAASQAQMAANTVKANATAALANEADLAVGTNVVLGRVAANIVAAQLVAAQVTTNGLTYAQLAQPAANTMPANATAGAANLADLSVPTNTVVGRAAGNIVAAQLVAAQVATNTLTAATQAQMAQRTYKGNETLATSNERDVSAQLMREGISGAVLTQTTAQLQTATVTNVTPGAYTIPANSLEAGSEYLCEFVLFAGRGATLTATNLIVELLANGAVVRTLTLAINIGASFIGGAKVEGRMTARTIGAGGTMMYTLCATQTIVAAAAALSFDPPPTGAAVGTTALDTTANRTLEMRARLSLATATCFVQLLHGTISKVR